MYIPPLNRKYSHCFFNADNGCLYFICRQRGYYCLSYLCIEERTPHFIAIYAALDKAVLAYRMRITESCLELSMDDAPAKAACFRRLAYYYFKRLACGLELNPYNTADSRQHRIYEQIRKCRYMEKKLQQNSNIPQKLVVAYYRYLHLTCIKKINKQQ